MKRRLKNIIRSLKVPAIWAFLVLFALTLAAQRVYLIRLGDRLLVDRQYLAALKNQNDDIERDIARLLETKELDRAARLDYGLRSANLNEVVVLSDPSVKEEGANNLALGKAFAAARRKLDDLVLGSFAVEEGGMGGSI